MRRARRVPGLRPADVGEREPHNGDEDAYEADAKADEHDPADAGDGAEHADDVVMRDIDPLGDGPPSASATQAWPSLCGNPHNYGDRRSFATNAAWVIGMRSPKCRSIAAA